jgi:hypothetical protein
MRNLFRSIFFIIIFFLYTTSSQAQPEALEALQQERLLLLRWASLVLAAWAMGNIVISSIHLPKASRSKRYFHQMNIIWNIVNLALAGYTGFVSFGTSDQALLLAQEVREHFLLERILLLSTGLDAAYIMTGAFLKERAHRSIKPERLNGYGNSLLLQGTFLLFYDLVFFFFLNAQTGVLYRLMG